MTPGGAHPSGDHDRGDEPSSWFVEPSGVRLQKVLAAAGVASRRVCESFIVEGRVSVNGVVVTELGRRIDPDVDRVEVDGTPVQLDVSRRYVILNKPVGVVSSMSDENGRPDLSTYAREFDERVFYVGRLDADTSGLMILTNDGDAAQALAHPKFGVLKTYVAKVRGRVTPQVIAKLTAGFDLDDGEIHADKARLLSVEPSGKNSIVEITLHSGRNRIVRRMLKDVGHPVIDLVRRSFGPLHLGTLPAGQWRDLTKLERGEILALARGGSTNDVDSAEHGE